MLHFYDSKLYTIYPIVARALGLAAAYYAAARPSAQCIGRARARAKVYCIQGSKDIVILLDSSIKDAARGGGVGKCGRLC